MQLNKRKLSQLTSACSEQTAAQRALLFDDHEHVGYKSSIYQDSYTPAQFFCINPLPSVVAPRKAEQLTARRNLLVEFDKPGWTLTKQETFYETKLQLPFATKTYSGGRSLHYIIALTESVSTEDYYLLFQLLQRACNNNSDKQVSNPNRLSRTAGVLRDGVNRQELLATGQRVTLEALTLKIANLIPVEYSRFLQEYYRNKELRDARPKDAPPPEQLPGWVQYALDTGKLKDYGRHEMLTKVATGLAFDGHDTERIENVLYQLQEKIGLERDDVPGIIRWLERRF